ncbi:aminotransferase class I/II-fold pyridoxal phosphate-dependent enzyme [Oceanobacillus piezotolerans]|uniref:Aminotransferase n=1 Tax=Oceanobacillus piezotolerans TaxID=2448030 RepID=A0A498D5Y0_9BACI|nr:LL-diaminopimelate aminotransferase [Oceanobacillus piezotolerans]RLL39996.1 aminotransferase class I/II-fold pyridoxal phosphate-dependent enzyme [Oceanobacillus piezotolerans]
MTFVSDKIKSLPPYLFAEFKKKKESLEKAGIDVIDLGIGSPDLPTPDFVINKLAQEMNVSANHRYSNYSGCLEFREAVASFYQRHYGVDLDPHTEVLTLIGSKEGIVNLTSSIINPGDRVLVPDPGYPVYRTGVHLAGGESVSLPLDTEKGYVPNFDKLSASDKEQAKLMFLNYPNNPTSATIELSTFAEATSFAKEHHIVLAHDAAYDLVTFNDYKAPSVMQVPNVKEVAVELGSLSKSFNMTGWRIGYIVGNKEVIRTLSTLKSNIDTSQFLPIQKAAATALRSDFSAVAANNKIYEERMEKLHTALQEVGIYAEKPKGTIFLWARVPAGFTSISFANKMLDEAGVIVTPGTAFGQSGEGFIRISLSVANDRLDEVVKRIEAMNIKEMTK